MEKEQKQTPLLATPHLRLRAMEPEDLETLYSIENDTRIWRFGATNVPFSRYVLRRFLDEAHNDIYADGQLRLMMEALPRRATVGIVDLFNFDPRNLRAEVGVVVSPSERGRGYGRAALSALSEYARLHLRLHQLYAFVATDNAAAMRLFAAAGYAEVARLPDWLVAEQGYVSAAIMQNILA